MFPGFDEQLRRYAAVIVQVGLNLRRGQRILVTDPYTLQGVSRAAAPLVAAVETAAREAGAAGFDVVWGDEAAWRSAALAWPDHAFIGQLEQNTRQTAEAISRGDALVFLESANPGLATGLRSAVVATMRQRCVEAYARFAPALLAAATNWTSAPAPTPAWADAVFPELPPTERAAALWSVVLEACRCHAADPVAAWVGHLAELEHERAALDRRRCTRVRLLGPGTDLSLALPPAHRWCTATLTARDGRRFVPNLPTEEVFTAPHPCSAAGRLRVARPICHGGAMIAGIELEFRAGIVVEARARTGGDLLAHLLRTDAGAMRVGEVALVPRRNAIARSRRTFHNALLDENALPHVALGDAYDFTAAPAGRPALNHSRLHLDLPVEAGLTIT